MQSARKRYQRPQAYHSHWQRLAHHHPDRLFGAVLIGGGLFAYGLALIYALS